MSITFCLYHHFCSSLVLMTLLGYGCYNFFFTMIIRQNLEASRGAPRNSLSLMLTDSYNSNITFLWLLRSTDITHYSHCFLSLLYYLNEESHDGRHSRILTVSLERSFCCPFDWTSRVQQNLKMGTGRYRKHTFPKRITESNDEGGHSHLLLLGFWTWFTYYSIHIRS